MGWGKACVDAGSEVDHGDAGTAKLDMLVGVVHHVGDGAQILAYELAQDAVALAVEDAHSLRAHEDGIVYIILYGNQRLVSAHAAHVEVLAEVFLVLVDGLPGDVRHRACTQTLTQFFGFG